MTLPRDKSKASVLLRHMAKFMCSRTVGAKRAFDLAWEDAQEQGTSPTDFIVGGLFGAYLREMRDQDIWRRLSVGGRRNEHV